MYIYIINHVSVKASTDYWVNDTLRTQSWTQTTLKHLKIGRHTSSLTSTSWNVDVQSGKPLLISGKKQP